MYYSEAHTVKLKSMMHTELTEIEETVFHWLCQVEAHLVSLPSA